MPGPLGSLGGVGLMGGAMNPMAQLLGGGKHHPAMSQADFSAQQGQEQNPGGMSWDQMMKLPRDAQTTVLNNLQTMGGVTPGMNIPAGAMGPQVAAQQAQAMRAQRPPQGMGAMGPGSGQMPQGPMGEPGGNANWGGQQAQAAPMAQPPSPVDPMAQQAAAQKQAMQKPMASPAPAPAAPAGPAEQGLQGMDPGMYSQMAAALRAR